MPLLIYYILALSLADMGLEFFPIHPSHSEHFWAWCVNNMVGCVFNGSRIGSDTILECGFRSPDFFILISLSFYFGKHIKFDINYIKIINIRYFSKFHIILLVLFIIRQMMYMIKNCHVTCVFVLCCSSCLVQYHNF